MYYNITHNPQKEYIITTPGEHIFYFENLNTDLKFTIAAENADVRIYGIYRGISSEKFSLSISQIHTMPRSKSITLIKSVLADKSCLHMTGKIRVEKHASHTEATLTNKNLILSDQAHVISMPRLEIMPHEVRCTHAANTTPLNTDQINYLLARGVSEDHAKNLLIDGFTQEILTHKK